ncbi:MAG: polyamine aminopropyltransferase [Alphaproteobacteria bacterium]
MSEEAPQPPAEATELPRQAYLPLLAATLVIAVSGLVYELIAGTVSSYLLGDSVTQFSLVIGLFMTAMGLGAWLSRYVRRLEAAFVGVQVALGLVGGFSAPLLFFAFVAIDNYQAFLFLVCIVVGSLVGLEIPLVVRILQRQRALAVNISNILTADYLGALVAALLFPLVLVPQLGLMAASLVFGLLNLAVAGLGAWLFRGTVARGTWTLLALAIVATATALALTDRLVGLLESRFYDSEILYAEDTAYQRLVLTTNGTHTQLYLNGGLQFDTIDEYRYHEALVHPAMTLAPRRAQVLILGGGDGMAAREVLRYADVVAVTLVDLDPAMTALFRDRPDLAALNGGALADPRVSVLNRDAWDFVRAEPGLFDVVIVDLPDPHTLAVSKLYSIEFYADLAGRLAADGVLVTQASSPLYAREAFWCVHDTLAAAPNPYAAPEAGETLATRPYHAYVPSFGEWGFVIAGARLRSGAHAPLPAGLRFLTAESLPRLFDFPPDMAPVPVEPNSILDHTLVQYYEQGWQDWFQ